MKTIVCGGRAFQDKDLVWSTLDARDVTFLIVGYDPRNPKFQGADELAYEWAKYRGVPGKCYPANWTDFGRGAGPRRNAIMAATGADRCIAFPGGIGTADMLAKARYAGIEVVQIEARKLL